MSDNPNQNKELLSQEWQILQTQFDSYEKFSLVIKLFNIGFTVFSITLAMPTLISLVIISIVWLQDGIWKTFQQRIEQRLLVVEVALAPNTNVNEANNETAPCQFNQHFLKNRAGAGKLITEYVKNACRPTVAYPHIVLLALVLLMPIFMNTL
ncbi:hypothetical protein J7384_05175 [Endozoicomonas sp. G2_1]|uniref:hypothetical protein n=1 Tax=Endozoicomonas sp. G2_1 TaxID=2821091 RepID=UPI001ADB12EF|nr:hypothetical protein [Endozoicomonas sp. G2_1]MBO9489753.1 hypothetical protein [Endozoicomonas sp. G2_1]